MKVTVTAVAGDRLLYVAGAGVRGTAEWRGSDAPPLGADVDVELDVKADVDWVHVIVDPSLNTSIDVADSELMLDGLVEDFDQYGVLSLRLPEGIVMIDTVGTAPIGIEGRRVHFSVEGAHLYPTNT